MARLKIRTSSAIILACAVFCSGAACFFPRTAVRSDNSSLVDLSLIDVDPKHPERTEFSALRLVSAFRLSSRDKRFGGLSGLSIGSDGRLYAISDQGFLLSAKMVRNENDALM